MILFQLECQTLISHITWAKINGGYLNIISGHAREAFEVLTGFGSIIYNTLHLDSDKKELVKKEIQNAYETNAFLSSSTLSEERVRKEGLIESHAYSMLSENKVKYENTDVILYKLRNPWSHQEWTGDWSKKSKRWNDKTK